MAHETQMFFFQNIRHFFPRFFNGRKVLEIGSLNVNGTVRIFFDNCEYTGIDIGPGECVDIVAKGEDFGATAGAYDVVISTEVFEHADCWDVVFLNMVRLMSRGGMLIFSCASLGRPQHGTRLSSPGAAPHVADSTDYYRNLIAADFTAAFNFDYWFSEYHFIEDLDCLYFVGIGKNSQEDGQTMSNFKSAYSEYIRKKHILGLSHQYITTGRF
jgi:SAM-dependent methyltransferase